MIRSFALFLLFFSVLYCFATADGRIKTLAIPTQKPSPRPSTKSPIKNQTMKPTTSGPSFKPSFSPSFAPTIVPTFVPSDAPTLAPSSKPNKKPLASSKPNGGGVALIVLFLFFFLYFAMDWYCKRHQLVPPGLHTGFQPMQQSDNIEDQQDGDHDDQL